MRLEDRSSAIDRVGNNFLTMNAGANEQKACILSFPAADIIAYYRRLSAIVQGREAGARPVRAWNCPWQPGFDFERRHNFYLVLQFTLQE
eukprot:2839433-Amphidinium_carterae.4